MLADYTVANPGRFTDFICEPALGPAPTDGQLALAALIDFDPGRGEPLIDYGGMLGGAAWAPRTALRTILAVCGRRSGKTSIDGGRYVLWRCLTADKSGLAKGEKAYFPVVAPIIQQARQLLDFVEGMGGARPNKDECVINDVIVRAMACGRGGGAVRSKSHVGAILDEAAFFQGDNHVLNAGDVYRAVKPGIATIPGGKCLLLTSPWAKEGLVWDLYRKNFGGPVTCLVAHAPTRLMRPDEPELLDEINIAYLEDPDAAAREFGAEFDSGGANAYFDGGTIDLACSRPTPAGDPLRTVLGLDLAQSRDSASLVGLSEWPNGHRAVTTLHTWTPSPGRPLLLTEMIPAICAYAIEQGVDRIYADHWEIVVANELCVSGVMIAPIPGGADGKASCYARLREILPQLAIPPRYESLAAQLRRVTTTLLPGGGVKISSPRLGNGHGDAVSAAAAAALQCLTQAPGGRYLASLRALSTADL